MSVDVLIFVISNLQIKIYIMAIITAFYQHKILKYVYNDLTNHMLYDILYRNWW